MSVQPRSDDQPVPSDAHRPANWRSQFGALPTLIEPEVVAAPVAAAAPHARPKPTIPGLIVCGGVIVFLVYSWWPRGEKAKTVPAPAAPAAVKATVPVKAAVAGAPAAHKSVVVTPHVTIPARPKATPMPAPAVVRAVSPTPAPVARTVVARPAPERPTARGKGLAAAVNAAIRHNRVTAAATPRPSRVSVAAPAPHPRPVEARRAAPARKNPASSGGGHSGGRSRGSGDDGINPLALP